MSDAIGLVRVDAVERWRDARLQRCIHEAVGHRLVVSAVHEPPAEMFHVDAALRPRGDVQAGNRQCPRQVREADDSRDLLDEIDFDADVGPVRRRGHGPAGLRLLDPHPEPDQDVVYIARRNLGAEHAPDALPAQNDGFGTCAVLFVHGFDDGARLATRNVDEQLRGPLHRLTLQVPCDRAFETVRCVGVHPAAPGLQRDGSRLEPGALEKHIPGRVDDSAFQPSHHACERDRP